jgi:hypothetical protein
MKNKRKFIVWGAWGRKFKSCHPDKSKNPCYEATGIWFFTGRQKLVSVRAGKNQIRSEQSERQGFFDLSLPFRRERFTTGKSCQVFHRLQETAVCSSSMQQQYAANLYIRKGAGIF